MRHGHEGHEAVEPLGPSMGHWKGHLKTLTSKFRIANEPAATIQPSTSPHAFHQPPLSKATFCTDSHGSNP